MNEAIGRKSGIPNPKSEASDLGASDLPKRSPVQEFESLWQRNAEEERDIRDNRLTGTGTAPSQALQQTAQANTAAVRSTSPPA